jgi:hypothetical protein
MRSTPVEPWSAWVWRPVTRNVLFASLALFYVLDGSLLGRD